MRGLLRRGWYIQFLLFYVNFRIFQDYKLYDDPAAAAEAERMRNERRAAEEAKRLRERSERKAEEQARKAAEKIRLEMLQADREKYAAEKAKIAEEKAQRKAKEEAKKAAKRAAEEKKKEEEKALRNAEFSLGKDAPKCGVKIAATKI